MQAHDCPCLQHPCRCTMIWLNHAAVTACGNFVCSGCCQRDQLTKVKLCAIPCPCMGSLPGTSEALAMPAQSFSSAAETQCNTQAYRFSAALPSQPDSSGAFKSQPSAFGQVCTTWCRTACSTDQLSRQPALVHSMATTRTGTRTACQCRTSAADEAFCRPFASSAIASISWWAYTWRLGTGFSVKRGKRPRV